MGCGACVYQVMCNVSIYYMRCDDACTGDVLLGKKHG